MEERRLGCEKPLPSFTFEAPRAKIPQATKIGPVTTKHLRPVPYLNKYLAEFGSVIQLNRKLVENLPKLD